MVEKNNNEHSRLENGLSPAIFHPAPGLHRAIQYLHPGGAASTRLLRYVAGNPGRSVTGNARTSVGRVRDICAQGKAEKRGMMRGKANAGTSEAGDGLTSEGAAGSLNQIPRYRLNTEATAVTAENIESGY